MATLADVAERAGVSVATAARVLSGHGYAAEATRRSVIEASRLITWSRVIVAAPGVRIARRLLLLESQSLVSLGSADRPEFENAVLGRCDFRKHDAAGIRLGPPLAGSIEGQFAVSLVYPQVLDGGH